MSRNTPVPKQTRIRLFFGNLAQGTTHESGYFITEGNTGPRDLQATILHLLPLDAWKFPYLIQGLSRASFQKAMVMGHGKKTRSLLAFFYAHYPVNCVYAAGMFSSDNDIEDQDFISYFQIS
jgi:hypothetical protein